MKTEVKVRVSTKLCFLCPVEIVRFAIRGMSMPVHVKITEEEESIWVHIEGVSTTVCQSSTKALEDEVATLAQAIEAKVRRWVGIASFLEAIYGLEPLGE